MLTLLLSVASSAFTQVSQDTLPSTESEERKPTVFQYFYSLNDVPKIVLIADFEKIIGNKYTLELFDTRMEITNADSTVQWDIKLSMRGKSRRQICDLPPLRLHFPRKNLKNNNIRRKYNTLKLVSYCKDKVLYERYVLREYMAYKMYNHLTDYSFKVKLVKVEYRDVNNAIRPIDRYGFIIENTDEMANRLNAKEKAKYALERDSLNNVQYDILALFQYMISNTDWRINALHNTKVIRDKDNDTYYAIPYDFDYSGFVNTEYSIPNPDYNQGTIYDRIFLGDCKEYEIMQQARNTVLVNKKNLMSCPDDWPIKTKLCKKALKFINKSYKILEKDKTFKTRCLQD